MTGLVYEDVRSFLDEGLRAKDYTDLLPAQPQSKPMPLLDVGPFSIVSLQDLSPGPIVFATVGNGAGLTLEQTYDQPFITIRAIGAQGDYTGAETMATDIDRLLLAINGNGMVGDTKVLYVTRSGGAPQLIDYDSGSRYHFQCTYIARSETGL